MVPVIVGVFCTCLLLGDLQMATASSALPKCTSDLDCSLNGVCDRPTGVCACDAPWVGNLDGSNTLPDCGFLNFTPRGSPVSPGQSKAGVFHGVNQQWTSWGSSVTRGKDGRFHAFVSEMANECDLGTWQQNSQVVHAVAKSPEGPFDRVDVVVPPLSHNPEVMIAPDGTAVIYTLFDGWSSGLKNCNKTSANSSRVIVGGSERSGQPHEGGVGNCTVISGKCNPGPCWQCTITMHASKDLNAPGPWQSYRTQIIGLNNNNGIPNYNPTAKVLKNGSIALMIHDEASWSGLRIAIADTWKGPYRITVHDPSITTCQKCLEDPYMCKLVPHRQPQSAASLLATLASQVLPTGHLARVCTRRDR